jgi:hypothetical protein
VFFTVIMAAKVLIAGQCGFDYPQLAALVKRVGAEPEEARTQGEFRRKVQSGEYSLVLLNRIFDSDGTSAIEELRVLKSESKGAKNYPPMMLISNYPEAHDEARGLGAVPGFGKADLGRPETKALLEQYLGD